VGQERLGPSYFFISLVLPSKQPRTVLFLKVYMELGSYFLFLQEQIKDIIIINREDTSHTSSRVDGRYILVLHAELASVRALLVKGLDHSNLPSKLVNVLSFA
jgi:hypothetical protein